MLPNLCELIITEALALSNLYTAFTAAFYWAIINIGKEKGDDYHGLD